MDELQKYMDHAEKAEAEIASLETEIRLLKDPSRTMAGIGITPELDQLRTENSKLKYQINHLKRSLEEEESKSSDCMTSILGQVERIFERAIHDAFPILQNPPCMVTPSTKEKFGDYQCNSAMAIVGQLKTKGQKANPREVAQNIVNKLPKASFIEKTEIAGPGFINVHLSKSYISQQLSELLQKGVKPPTVGMKKKIIVDMSSPNIAKEMHVGHLRSTIIGDSIANLCEFVGHEVLKLSHLGDWGTQFGMLITHLIDKFPNYKTVSPPIGDLQAFYKESKERFDNDEQFKKRAYAAVVKLQSYDPDYIKAWNLICEESSREFTKVYERLDIQRLVNRGESFYQEMMKNMVEDMDKKGMLELDEGRKICWAPGEKAPLTIVKADGGYTYDTSDFTALHHRIFVEKVDWIIYVIDQGQSVHMNTVFKAAAHMGWFDQKKTRVEHVGFGLVLGEDNVKGYSTGWWTKSLFYVNENVATKQSDWLCGGNVPLGGWYSVVGI